jgi:hypothetical protein
MTKERFDVGDMIYGFCNGYFGRDDYSSKICIFSTDNFALFVYLENPNTAVVLNYNEFKDKSKMWLTIDKWRNENEI